MVLRFFLVVACVIFMTDSGDSAASSGLPQAAAFAAPVPPADQASQDAGSGEIPLLPIADPNAEIPKVKLGETVRFEELGPIIINTDGTTRRIENWDKMTDKEKEVTWRRISKRNEARRKALLESQRQEGESEKEDEL